MLQEKVRPSSIKMRYEPYTQRKPLHTRNENSYFYESGLNLSEHNDDYSFWDKNPSYPAEYFEYLLKQDKLILLLDLDQTLVDTTTDVRAAFVKDVVNFTYGKESKTYYTRLRYKANEFLRSISKYFELYACTIGSRDYAERILHLLDPNRVYFNKTTFTRDDNSLVSKDSKVRVLMDVFSNGLHMTCIVDDRSDVWGRMSNLVRAKPFHFFKKIFKDEVFDDVPPSLSPFNVKEEFKLEFDDKEFFLDHLLSSLRLIHKAYFTMYKISMSEKTIRPEMMAVMPYIQRKILRGAKIVVDHNIFKQYPNENNEVLEKYARQMGAEMHSEIVQDTTHFISFEPHLRWKSEFPNLRVVSPNWLIYSYERWEKISEEYFETS